MREDLTAQLQKILGTAYKIERELGGAGMSRVFVATETALDRQVVVKVLHPDLSAGINLDRFRREIQLAARLQHPHIVPLVAAGADESLLYYTMPFIGGENLRTRLNKTRELPIPEAARIVRDVADALGYAHSQGVIHRDIKPENILISGNHALVTDFGVSKALSNATSELPGDTPSLTSLGIALGTPTYMAPEQALADPQVDSRADIYALGIVAYELLAGRTPFAGLNQQQTLAAHISTTSPPVDQYRQLPEGLAPIIMRCLEKHPSDRWQRAEDLHAALEPFTMTSGATAPSRAVAAPRKSWTPQRIAVAAGVAGIVVTAMIVSTFAFRGNRESLVVGNTKQTTNDAGLEVHPSVSPDGRMIAYAAGPPNRSRIYVKQLSGGRAIALTDTIGTTQWPRWSPDGARILFTGDRRRSYIVNALGGVVTPFGGTRQLFACTWSNAGDKAACFDPARMSVVVTSADGENARELPATKGNDGSTGISFSPDDKAIAFVRNNAEYTEFNRDIGNIAPSSIWLTSLSGGTPVKITDDTHLNTSPVWTPEGDVLYVSSARGNRDVYLQKLSGSLKPKGAPVRMTTGLNAHTISLDRSGKILAYSVFTTNANVWRTPIPASPVVSPRMEQITTGNQTIENADVSPDSRTLTYDSNINGNQDIYRIPVAGGEAQQLTHNGVDNFSPKWSPDGSEIVFHSLVRGNRDVLVVNAESGKLTSVVATASEERAPRWRDENRIAFQIWPDSIFEVSRPSRNAVWGRPRLLWHAFTTVISPDGTQAILSGYVGTGCNGPCPRGPYWIKLDGNIEKPIDITQLRKTKFSPGTHTFSPDSRHAYLATTENDGSCSIWRLAINGDTEMRLVHLTDPARQLYRGGLSVDRNYFYVTIGDRQSDIWTMELKKQ